MGADWEWRTVQRLAAAVVIQAIADARNGDEDAARWLDRWAWRWCSDYDLGTWRRLSRWRRWVGKLRVEDPQRGGAGSGTRPAPG